MNSCQADPSINTSPTGVYPEYTYFYLHHFHIQHVHVEINLIYIANICLIFIVCTACHQNNQVISYIIG